jgi:cytochrome c-type biogenesis protein CcmE
VGSSDAGDEDPGAMPERAASASGRPDGPLTPSTLAPATTRSGRKPRKVSWRLWVAGAVLVGAFVFLLVQGLGGSLNYFETVDQAVAHKATLGSQTFRLEGLVVPGSVHRSAQGVSFVAAGTHHRVPVVNTGAPPQLFGANIPVVVVGHFSGTTFYSDQVIIDHSANYIQAHPNRVRAPNGTVR